MTAAPPLVVPNRQRESAPVVENGIEANLFTTGRLRRWGTKSLYSLLDQALTSLAVFCMGFLLARWMASELYGAYAVAFAGYLFVAGFHNVIVLEPISVMGPARYAGRLRDYFNAQVRVHFVLVGVFSVAVLFSAALVRFISPRTALVGAMVGSALALPLLLFLALVRRMCYILQRPTVAILGSSACLLVVLPGLYVLRAFGRASPLAAFLLAGCGSLIGSCLMLHRVAALTSHNIIHRRIDWMCALRENWSYGRWLVGSNVLYCVVGQVQMLVAASLLGLAAAGALRAMLVPASAMSQAITAAGLLILPGFSYDFGRGEVKHLRRKAVLVSLLLCGAGLGYAALLTLVSGRAEHLLFAGKYAAYAWLMPILALMPAANGFTLGYSTALRAAQKPQFDLLANAVAAPVALLSALCFIRWWGLAGAAASIPLGFAVCMIVNCGLFYATPQTSSRVLRAAPAKEVSVE